MKTSSIPRSSVFLGLCLFMAGYLFSSISRLLDCSSTFLQPLTIDLGPSHRSVQVEPTIDQEQVDLTFPTKSLSPFSKDHLQGIATAENQVFPYFSHLPLSKKQSKNARLFKEAALAAHQHLHNLTRSKSVHVLMPDIARDDELVGKSCRFVSETRDWDCRDCGLEQSYLEWKECPTLSRNHMCGEQRNNNDWDRPQPRSYTYLDTAGMETYNILTHYANAPVHHAQIPCDDLEQCWNMTRCTYVQKGGPMTVYVRHASHKRSRATKFAKLAAKRYPRQVKIVDRPSEACLLVVACDAFDSVQHLQADRELWNEGRNHFIYDSNVCFDARADRPFDYPHYARASLGTSSLVNANIRPQYDVPLARTKPFIISEANYTQVLRSMGQDRPRLVAFKGNVYTDWSQVWWQHRWMAAEYWDKTDDEVAVDVTCDIKPDYTDEYDYLELLMNSTFAFCPGGGATQSFRFTEALALGAIPVVTPDLLPPFAHDLDWSGCVVRMSAARIVDMPRLLRQISKDEIRQRQARCQALFETTVGWVPDKKGKGQWKIDVDRTLFMTSLRIWSSRIQQHFLKQQIQAQLEKSLFVVSKDGSHDFAA